MEIPLREVFGVPALKSNLSATQTESGVRTSNFLPNFIKDTASVKALQEFLEDPYETLNSNIKFSMGLQIHQLDSCSFVGVSNSEQLTYNCMNRSYILAQYTETIAETSADNDCSDKVLQRYVETSDDKNLTKHEKSLLKNEKYLYDRVEKHLILKSQVEEMVYDLPLKAGQSWQFAKVMPVQIVEIYNVPVVKTTLPYSARFIELSEQLNKLSATIYKQQEEEMTIFYKNLIPILDLTKLLKDNINGLSPFEECAILRLLCIVNSLDPDLYKFDPIKYQVIRRATCDVNSFEASIINEHTMYPDCRLLVTTLHTAVNIVTGEVFSDLPEPFNRNSLDDEWTMVPVRLCMSSDTLVPYIAAFMTSRLWAGSVNLKWSMTWFDSNWEKAKTGFYYGMPRCNSVQIPGPRNVMLVIVDGDCQHIPQIMRIGNLNVDVYQKGKKAIPCDFTTIWKEFFQTKNIKRIRTTCLNAINEICNLLAVGKACGAATALAAELYGGWQPGLYTDADTENSFSNCLSGAYAYGNSSTPNTIDKHNGKVLANVWVPKETNGVKKPCVFNSSGGNKVLMGFNFASHSPLLMYASGKIDVKVKEYYEHVLDTSGKELGKLKSASLYWDYRSNCLAKYPASYRVRQASSLMRLSIAVGLISTQQPMFWNLSGTTPWIHIVALAMASQTNVMLLKNDVSLRDWMGIEINITDGLIPAKRRRVLSFSTNGRVLDIFRDNEKHKTFLQQMTFHWYHIDPAKNPWWMTFSGLPFTLVYQWAQKLNIPFGDQIPTGGPILMNCKNVSWAIKVKPCNGINKVVLVSTNDAVKYLPKIKGHLSDVSIPYVPTALEQWSMISLNDFVPQYASQFSQVLQSNTFCGSVDIFGSSYDVKNAWYVIDSKMAVEGYSNKGVCITPLRLH